MAEQQKTYPMLPIAHWWTLRKKFKSTIPTIVNQSYLAGVLKMEARSASANVLPYLKTLGIIDGEGKTTERAKLWRDDTRYAVVCKDILKEVYPPELLESVSDSSQRDQVEGWFAHATGVGEAAVGRMAALYCVLLEADASKQPGEKAERIRVEKKVEKKPVTVSPPVVAALVEKAATTNAANSPQISGININLEIHISADSSADQIDTIFKSMAKHIYQRG